MKEFDLLIKNCRVLKPDFSVLEDADLCVNGNRITLIGHNSRKKDAYKTKEVIDGSGKLAMPGFVDGHTHAAQQLLRGSVIDELPMVWTRILVPFESTLTPEDVYNGAMLFCVENLKAGITTFADAGGPHMESVARAAEQAGIRAVIARSTMYTGDLIPEAIK